jgi:hypothetical protein
VGRANLNARPAWPVENIAALKFPPTMDIARECQHTWFSCINRPSGTHHRETVRMLLELGADAKALTPHHGNILHCVTQQADTATLRVILDWGAANPGSIPDVLACAKDRITPRHIATLRLVVSLNTVKLLLHPHQTRSLPGGTRLRRFTGIAYRHSGLE